MKARAAASRARKKQAGTGSKSAAVRKLAEGRSSGRNARQAVTQEIKADVVNKPTSKKKARRVRGPLHATQSQTHRARP